MRQHRSNGGAKWVAVVSLFLLLAVCATAGCGAQTALAESFGDVTFHVPAGWRRAERDGTMLLVPPGLPAGQSCVLTIFPGEELRGDFRAAFDSARQALQRGERVAAEGEVTAERNPNGFDTLSALVLMQDGAGKSTYRFYLAAHPGTRFELLVFAATNDDLFKQFFPALKEFVSSMRFASAGAGTRFAGAAAGGSGSAGGRGKAATAGASLSGLYVSTESRQQFNVNTKFYDYIVRQVYYLFAPDGRVYRGLPKGGALDDFDFDRAEQEDPSNCGTYRIVGGTIQFEWPGAALGAALDFGRAGDGLRIGRSTFLRVKGFGGGQLEGVYARGSFANLSGGAGVSSGGVGGENAIAFSRDGSFAQRGFVGFAGSGGGAGAASSEGSQATGTYRVSGHTLELDYGGGRRARLTFFQYPREPNVLVIDGVTYLRR